MTKNDISTEEKIDYIYSRLKRQEKLELAGFIFKWATRIFIVASLVYFFMVKLPVLKEEIIESITPEVPKFDVETITNSDVLDSIKEKFGTLGKEQLENLDFGLGGDSEGKKTKEEPTSISY